MGLPGAKDYAGENSKIKPLVTDSVDLPPLPGPYRSAIVFGVIVAHASASLGVTTNQEMTYSQDENTLGEDGTIMTIP